MRLLLKSFNLQPLLRFLGLSLLIMIALVQSVAHASAVPMGQDHAIHQDMTGMSPDCLNHDVLSVDIMEPATERSDTGTNGLHCMPSMCCFHGEMSAPELHLLGEFVSTDFGPERHVALASHSEILKDRPPQPV